MKISQSLLKSLLELKERKECGIIYKTKFIDNRFDLFPPSDTQNLGAWFEYLATGSIPKNGDIPEARYLLKPDENGNPKLAADYELVYKQVKNYKNLIEKYKIKVLEVGKKITWTDPEGDVWEGVLDIWAEAEEEIRVKDEFGYFQTVVEKGQKFVIDLKNTGLLDDKWHDFGWELNNLHNKVKLVTQPIHYKYIIKQATGEEPPFLFMLFSSRDEHDHRVIDFRVDDSTFSEHELFVVNAKQWHKTYLQKGFPPLPSPHKCSSCWLNNDYRKRMADERGSDGYIEVRLNSGQSIRFKYSKKVEKYTAEYEGVDIAIFDENKLDKESIDISSYEYIKFGYRNESLPPEFSIKQITAETKEDGYIIAHNFNYPDAEPVTYFNYDKKSKSHIADINGVKLILLEDGTACTFEIVKKQMVYGEQRYSSTSLQKETKLDGYVDVDFVSGERLRFTYDKKQGHIAIHQLGNLTLNKNEDGSFQVYRLINLTNEYIYSDIGIKPEDIELIMDKRVKIPLLKQDCPHKSVIAPITIYYFAKQI